MPLVFHEIEMKCPGILISSLVGLPYKIYWVYSDGTDNLIKLEYVHLETSGRDGCVAKCRIGSGWFPNKYAWRSLCMPVHIALAAISVVFIVHIYRFPIIPPTLAHNHMTISITKCHIIKEETDRRTDRLISFWKVV